MENIINHLLNYQYIYIGVLLIILLVLIIAFYPKKVKPIEITKDDVLDEPKSEIEKVIEALEDKSKSRPMTTFEEEQEASAIISYQELVKAVEEKKASKEIKSNV